MTNLNLRSAMSYSILTLKMKASISVLVAIVLQYVQAAQPTTFTQSRCLTAYSSKSGFTSTTTIAYTLTFRPPVIYTLTRSTIVTPTTTTSKYSCLLNHTPHYIFYMYQLHYKVRTECPMII